MHPIFDSIVRAVSWSMAYQTVSRPQYYDYTQSTSVIAHGRIAGGSPLRYCNESRDTDLYQIEHIELYPSPLHMYFLQQRFPRLCKTNNTVAEAMTSSRSTCTVNYSNPNLFNCFKYSRTQLQAHFSKTLHRTRHWATWAATVIALNPRAAGWTGAEVSLIASTSWVVIVSMTVLRIRDLVSS